MPWRTSSDRETLQVQHPETGAWTNAPFPIQHKDGYLIRWVDSHVQLVNAIYGVLQSIAQDPIQGDIYHELAALKDNFVVEEGDTLADMVSALGVSAQVSNTYFAAANERIEQMVEILEQVNQTFSEQGEQTDRLQRIHESLLLDPTDSGSGGVGQTAIARLDALQAKIDELDVKLANTNTLLDAIRSRQGGGTKVELFNGNPLLNSAIAGNSSQVITYNLNAQQIEIQCLCSEASASAAIVVETKTQSTETDFRYRSFRRYELHSSAMPIDGLYPCPSVAIARQGDSSLRLYVDSISAGNVTAYVREVR